MKTKQKTKNKSSLKVDKDFMARNNLSKFEYSRTNEDTKHIKLKDKYDLLINGKLVKTKKYFKTINPSTEKVLAKAGYASKEDVNKAVLSAEKAYNGWRKISPKENSKYMYRIARILQEKARQFAVIESMDGGKPSRES